MRKTVITYFLFIIAMSAFIALRLAAGKAMARERVGAETAAHEVSPEENLPGDEQDTTGKETPGDTQMPDEEETKVPEDKREYLWHGDIEPAEQFTGELPRIICWGDSLTDSLDDRTAYPDILRELSGCEVINYGVDSENTAMIAMREGGLRVNVRATVIPSEPDLIPVFLRTENDGHVFYLNNGDGGVNPCMIGPIEGDLEKLNGSYYFRRRKRGERYVVDDGTQFITHAMNDKREDDVLVIFAGTNDLPDRKGADNIIKLERAMLEYAGCDRYIIIGLTYAGAIPEIDAVNEAMEEEFGDHFVDIRKYLLNYGIEDAGVIMTPKDTEDIKKGEIPASLRRDYVHGNRHYHRLLGEQVYRRMVYLGYLPEGASDTQ